MLAHIACLWITDVLVNTQVMKLGLGSGLRFTNGNWPAGHFHLPQHNEVTGCILCSKVLCRGKSETTQSLFSWIH